MNSPLIPNDTLINHKYIQEIPLDKNLNLNRIRNKRTALEFTDYLSNNNSYSVQDQDDSNNTLPLRRKKIKKTLIRRLRPLPQTMETSTQIIEKMTVLPRRRQVVVRRRKPVQNVTPSQPAIELSSNLSPTATITKVMSSSETSNETNTQTTSNRMARRCNQTKCTRRRQLKKLKKTMTALSTASIQPTSTQTITSIVTSTLVKQELSTETQIVPKTYTYVVDRVHENEHQIQSSTLIRSKTITITHTLLITDLVLFTNTQVITVQPTTLVTI